LLLLLGVEDLDVGDCRLVKDRFLASDVEVIPLVVEELVVLVEVLVGLVGEFLVGLVGEFFLGSIVRLLEPGDEFGLLARDRQFGAGR